MSNFAAKFKSELAKLNPAQKQAVDTLEGPVMVFAGPGTGKTQILTLRIANLISQGLAEPAQILALTFTTSAAANMRTRLGRMIGTAGLQVPFFTFHEFCQTVIGDHPEVFPFGEHALPLGDLERIDILQQVIDQVMPPSLRPTGAAYTYLEAISSAIQNLKAEYVTPEKYRQLLAQEKKRVDSLIDEEMARKRPRKTVITHLRVTFAKQEELADLYEHYNRLLSERHRYDFADMILQTVSVFREQPDILAQYQEKFQYLLVDEYQDTNNSQNAVLDALASFWGEQANIFVVGDPYQSIYRFQGANVENFLGFTSRYPAARVINLLTGYRCHAHTYALAHALTHEMSPLEVDGAGEALKSGSHLSPLPALLTACPSQQAEIINIFTRIRSLIASGTPPEQIAIIYRKNREADALLTAAAHYGIACEIEGGADVLEMETVIWILQLCRLCAHLEDRQTSDSLVYQLLWRPFWHADTLAVVKLIRLAREKRWVLWDILADRRHPAWLELAADGVSEQHLAALENVGNILKDLAAQAANLPPSQFIALLLEKSGILAWVRTRQDYLHQLTAIFTFTQAVGEWCSADPYLTLAGVLTNFDLMRQHNLHLPLQDLNARDGAIALTTAHKAKGREWDYVFIYGLNKGVWDHARAALSVKLPAGIITMQSLDDKESILDEEKRLFYVALTRARRQNFLSWHESEISAARTRQMQASDLVFFLQKQVTAGLVEEAPLLLDAAALTRELDVFLAPAPERDWGSVSRDYLQGHVKNLKLSATMLNDYLSDVNVFIERHLLGAPGEPASTPQLFGNSFHRTLERALRPQLTGADRLSLDAAKELFAADFGRAIIEKADLQAWTSLGLDSLELYYRQLATSPVMLVALERKFGDLPPVYLDDIPLTGKIDRIDQLDADTGEVIDYKTGQHLTMGQLLGTTASSKLSAREQELPECIRSPYKRQLLFYKLLCERDPEFHLPIARGALHFVKSEKGKIDVRQFTLPDEEVAALADLIRQVWREIQELSFWTGK